MSSYKIYMICSGFDRQVHVWNYIWITSDCRLTKLSLPKPDPQSEQGDTLETFENIGGREADSSQPQLLLLRQSEEGLLLKSGPDPDSFSEPHLSAFSEKDERNTAGVLLRFLCEAHLRPRRPRQRDRRYRRSPLFRVQ